MIFGKMNISLSFVFSKILLLYIFLGTFYSVDSFKPVALASFLVLLIVNILLTCRIIYKKSFKIKNKVLFFLFLFAFIFMLFSSFYNFSIELFLGVLNFLFCFLFFSLHQYNGKVYEVFDFPIKALFITTTLLNVIINFSFPFQGVFSNPNSLGGLYATISIIASGVFVDKFKDKDKTDWILLILLIFSPIFSLLSNSRISFVLSLISLIFVVFFRFGGWIFIENKKLYFNFKKIISLVLVVISLLFFIMVNFRYISDIFLQKFLIKLENDNFSAGRSEIWKVILENQTFFGHGRNSIHLENIGLAAHNTFMSILDQFGFLSSAIFFLATLFCLIIYINPKNIIKYGVLPLFIILGFLFMSISESMINKTIMFCLLAVLNLKSYSILEKK